MWNTFYDSKNNLENPSDSDIIKSGMSDSELISKVSETIKTMGNAETEKTKAETISFILKNAILEINIKDIFAYNIHNCNIMVDFFIKLREKNYTPKNWNPRYADAYSANMDFGHVAPDWQYILNKGISGIISDLEENRKNNPQKIDYYNNRIKVYSAIKECFLRYADLADTKNSKKTSFIGENLRHLSKNPPETLYQAMQLILLLYNFQTNLDLVTIRSLGGLDRMLYPFYKKDLESGRFSKDNLNEIVKYFLFEIKCMNTLANLPFYICGMDENGNDATNEFTFCLLKNYRELDIYDPKIHVMYHKNIDKPVLDLILEIIREGKNSFVFINTEIASEALMNIGISPEDAKKVTVYGCYETAAEGTEIPCTCAGNINLAKAVELTLKTDRDFNSFEDFYSDVKNNLIGYTIECMDKIADFEIHFKDICPSLFMSPTYKNSRESGTDLYSGGGKYNNTSIVGAGFATLVDSIVAVKKAVFKDKTVTLKEFKNILSSDFKENEKIRLIIKKKYPKFGNNLAETDDVAVDIYNTFADTINGRKNNRGGIFRCGMFSVDWRFWMGEKTNTTPDGRLKGEPLSKNLCASLGQDKNGVTAYLNSLIKLDSLKCPDGYVADVVLHSSAVKGKEGMLAFKSLLLSFMQRGGFSVHFNILNPETLINAQKEPEKYQNLQIRLCGWNVRFIDLDKAQQDEFIKQSVNVL